MHEPLPNLIDGLPWWKSAVVYQIYPRSFLDTSGNGVGDLRGVIDRLDYLSWLGVDAIWLSPIFPSPMVDHGYDVADYCDIEPLFGTLDTCDELIAGAHRRGIRVLLDWVANHSSDQHRWFVESRASRDNPKRNWYIWRDGSPDTPPNNWLAEFPEGPAWTWDETTGAWYLHLFTPEQPDLNWDNPEVRAAMHDTLRFWLDRGVDGFRMDVVHLIGKPEGLPDRAAGPGAVVSEINEPVVHEYLRGIRSVLDEYPQAPTSVGEVALYGADLFAAYHGNDDELHMSFNFSALITSWDADAWREQIAQASETLGAIDAWPTWVLSNHDIPRHRGRHGGSEEVARAIVFLSLLLRGTPFLYAGEEFGLIDADVPVEQQQDPGRWRDGCRAPVPWEPSPTHGWVREDNWLPFPPEAELRNAETLGEDQGSILHLYRDLLRVRRAEPALRVGDQALLEDVPSGVVGWERSWGDARFFVMVNMSSEDVRMDLDADLVLSSEPRVGAWDGTLGPDSAVLLRSV